MAGIGSQSCGQGLGMRQGGSKYASERYNPTMPRCGTLYITFDGEFVQLQGGERSYVYVAASGRRVGSRFDYSLERQDDSGGDPFQRVPIGSTLTSCGRTPGTSSPPAAVHGATIASRCIPIPPPKPMVVGFFIHGGDELGSAGCIDLATSMDAFVKICIASSERLASAIQVTVRYRSPR